MWRNSDGQTEASLAADGNNDGAVNQSDYAFWRARFGNTFGSGCEVGGAAVSESAAATMLLMLLGTFGATQRHPRC